MTLQFTPDGIQVDTLEDIVGDLAEGMRSIYGQGINLDQDSPDGQRLGLFAKQILDLQTLAAKKYHSMDPDIAEGHSLDVISKIAGVSRRSATQSTWDIEITASNITTLEADYTIEDELGQQWILDEDITLAVGVNTATFTASEFGSIEGVALSELKQVTINPVITALNASKNAVIGIDEELDEDSRTRRNRSLENPALSTMGGLFAKLANPSVTPNVLDLQVYENDSDDYDNLRNIPAHTLWAVVEGGTLEDITKTITKNKTGGTGTKGAISGQYLEQRIRPDGSEFTHVHEMRFDRPIYVELYIKVKAKRRNSVEPIDLVLIAQKISSEIFYIGSDIQASQLYAQGYQAGTGFTLYDLEISSDNVLFTDQRLIAGYQSKFVLIQDNITIEEVI